MHWRKSSGSSCGSVLRVGALSAALAIGAATLSLAGAAAAREACEVRLTEIRLDPYVSGGLTLHRARLVGDHNYSAATNTGGPERTRFEIIDNDGFFILAIFTARWGMHSEARDDIANRRIPRGELLSLYRAMEMGIAYYERGRVIISERRPDNLTEVLAGIDNKIRAQRRILSELDRAGAYRASDDTVALDLFVVTQMTRRFRYGPGREMASQYRDVALGDGAHGLCDRDARSPLIGRLACPLSWGEIGEPPEAQVSRLRDRGCPDGLTFSPVLFPPAQT
jgi:hypothetical protein